MRAAFLYCSLSFILACSKGPSLTTSPGHLSVILNGEDLSGGSDDFGQSCPGFPVQQTLTLSNTGDVQVNVKAVQITGDFSLTPVPSFPLAVGSGETSAIIVTFAPTASQAGGQAGTLTVTSDAENSTLTVNLTGTVSSAAAQPSFSSSCTFSGQTRTPCSFLDFPSVPIGASSTQTVQIQNTGCAPLTLSTGIVPDAGVFSIGAPPTSLSLGQTIPLTVTFTPVSQGAASATLVFSTNDPQGGAGEPAGEFAVTLSGVSSEGAQLTLSPPSWASTTAMLAGQTFTVANSGGTAVTLDGPQVVENDDAGVFALDAGWPTGFVLDAGASVSCVVTSEVPSPGAFGATLVVPYGTSQLTAPLTANSIADLCTSPALQFGPALLCGPRVTEDLEIFVCDGGDAPIDISSIVVSPNPSGAYTLMLPTPSTGPWTVAPGSAGLNVGITFQDDGTLQQADAQLVIASNALSQATLNVPISNMPAYVPPAIGVPVLVDGGAATVGAQLLFQVQPSGAPNYAYQFYWVAQSSGATPPDAGLLVLDGVPGADVAFVPYAATPGTNSGYRVCVDQVEVDAGAGSCGFDAGLGTGQSAGCSQVIVVGS